MPRHSTSRHLVRGFLRLLSRSTAQRQSALSDLTASSGSIRLWRLALPRLCASLWTPTSCSRSSWCGRARSTSRSSLVRCSRARTGSTCCSRSHQRSRRRWWRRYAPSEASSRVPCTTRRSSSSSQRSSPTRELHDSLCTRTRRSRRTRQCAPRSLRFKTLTTPWGPPSFCRARIVRLLTTHSTRAVLSRMSSSARPLAFSGCSSRGMSHSSTRGFCTVAVRT
mmetsp:Transcript_1170/g.2455  ORF Transcript_1170/g.2455 Transcript_1170/m.2455 type:complete len:223 (+) Transcript_1170:436-1104(+)